MRAENYYPGFKRSMRWEADDVLVGYGNTKGEVWYVDGDRSTGGAGQDWDDAFPTITEALAAATTDDVIFVGQGTYAEESLVVTQDNLKIIGVGTGAFHRGPTIYNSAKTTDIQLMNVDAHNVEIAGLRFIVPNDAVSTAGSNTAYALTYAGSHYGGWIHHCSFQALGNYWGCALALGCHSGSFESGTVENNHFHHGANHIRVKWGSRMMIRNNHFTMMGDNAEGNCIRYESTTNASFGVSVKDNDFELMYTTGGYGIFVKATPTEGYFHIGGNRFSENFTVGHTISKLTGYESAPNTYGDERIAIGNPVTEAAWD